jgi:guanylate cyclase
MWRRAFDAIQAIGHDPSDSVETQIQKRMLVAVSGLVMVAAAGWAALYWWLEEPTAALIPAGYSVLTAVNLIVFSRTKRYQAFRATQLLLILVLPFVLQLNLGGFVGASAVILWALMAPLGALITQGRKQAVSWMVAYAALLIVSLVIQPSMQINNNLSNQVVGVFFLMNLVAVSGTAFLVLNYFVGQRDRIQAQLEVEQEKSESLLLNVLPADVANDLKEQGETKARSYDSVSVLFADMVGFTSYADTVSPDEMLGMLNEVVTRFDEIVSTHNVEKIRTIGDAYMAASGVPVVRADQAQAMARAALEMVAYIESLDVDFRIGIHTGPLVAGVIGTTKFQYDIWGDTVNTASRMESSGEAGRIHISESTYKLINNEFRCEERGTITVKGKGSLKTWWLVEELA